MSIVPFTKLFYGAHSFFYYQHGRHVERVTIIESSLGTKQNDPLRFPSLVDDTHIVGPMNEVTRAFDHLSTQLTLVGLKVKVSKCKLWSPLKISPNIEIPQGYTLVLNGLRILGVSMGTQDFATHFLDKVLS
jgi:hypothetical protein